MVLGPVHIYGRQNGVKFLVLFGKGQFNNNLILTSKRDKKANARAIRCVQNFVGVGKFDVGGSVASIGTSCCVVLSVTG